MEPGAAGPRPGHGAASGRRALPVRSLGVRDGSQCRVAQARGMTGRRSEAPVLESATMESASMASATMESASMASATMESAATPVERGGRVTTVLAVVGICLVVAVAFALHAFWVLPNHDNDWYLIAARRLLAGGRYG